jgi:syndecan 4
MRFFFLVVYLLQTGKYQAFTTQSTCTSCVAGFYCGTTGMSTYVSSDCPAGTFSSAGASACTPCPAGYYSSSAETAACSACGAGTFSNLGSGVAGSTDCEECEGGQYQASAAQSACKDCPVATYVSGTGAVACVDCSAGR